ncbi:NAD(P)-dependent oxidoreductase [Marinobacterium rhizophilum]|uniref:NAD(P)-dependent oxidoreductase n=1 Tax=Marinobacterium rhizophilum TaxID=420402 RepID=A0ABY5HM74_9GAMM|nr:NAD(P)-dependent oxidoreductase [Marinobacterium rhizophilum]UTW13500.1 NAD(P)-dependent oxidoreductase [Marinobacterium rhizophilum]
MNQPRIAFLGIGLMGHPMALNLLRAGYPLNAWNRTFSKAESLRSDGALPYHQAQDAVKDADIVISMLENGPVVDAVLFSEATLAALKPGALVIDMSSIPPAMAKRHHQLLAERQHGYLDAPVSGGTLGAEQACLSIMAGGSKADFERAGPIFSRLGKAATYIGPAGSGQLAKCANQAIVGITIGAVSEALLLAAQGGADPAAVREALLGGFASSRILELHGQRMIDRSFMPGATARVQLKDLQTILDTAQQEDLQLPLAEQAFAQYKHLVERGLDGVDHSGLLLQLEALNAPARLNDRETIKPNDMPEA